VVDVTPGQVVAAGDVVELVAEVAIADVGGVESEGEGEQELGGGEGRGEAERGPQAEVGGADGGGGRHVG
jgi:hypothetical protein